MSPSKCRLSCCIDSQFLFWNRHTFVFELNFDELMNLFMVLSPHTFHMCEWWGHDQSRYNQSMCEPHNKSQFAAITPFCTPIRPYDAIVIDVGEFAVFFVSSTCRCRGRCLIYLPIKWRTDREIIQNGDDCLCTTHNSHSASASKITREINASNQSIIIWVRTTEITRVFVETRKNFSEHKTATKLMKINFSLQTQLVCTKSLV